MYNRLVLAVLRAVFLVWRRLRGRTPRPAPASVERILLVSTTGLGDTIMAGPAVAVARQAWPRAEIRVMAHRRWADLLSANPDIDGLIIYPGKFKRLVSLVRELRALHPDLAFIIHGNDPDIVPLVYMSGARFIAGWATSRFAFLMDRTAVFDNDRPYIERRVDVIRTLAGNLEAPGEKLYLPPSIVDWADRFWEEAGLAPEERLLALNPGGSHQSKRWPDEHWQALIQTLGRDTGFRLALFGSPAEEAHLAKLAGAAGAEDAFIVARSNVLEAAALLPRAEALIGPDSGLAHAAVALDVPAAVIFGPDNPALTGPYLSRAPSVVLQAEPRVCPDVSACRLKRCDHRRCMHGVTPDQVLRALAADLNLGLDFTP